MSGYVPLETKGGEQAGSYGRVPSCGRGGGRGGRGSGCVAPGRRGSSSGILKAAASFSSSAHDMFSNRGRPKHASAARPDITFEEALDGGDLARAREAVQLSKYLKVHYGNGIVHDPKLREILDRESFLLQVLNPRFVGVRQATRAIAAYFSTNSMVCLSLLYALYVGTAASCAAVEPGEIGNSFCNGGPVGDGGELFKFTFGDYRPAYLNVIYRGSNGRHSFW